MHLITIETPIILLSRCGWFVNLNDLDNFVATGTLPTQYYYDFETKLFYPFFQLNQNVYLLIWSLGNNLISIQNAFSPFQYLTRDNDNVVISNNFQNVKSYFIEND
jgi:hypothetical protein